MEDSFVMLVYKLIKWDILEPSKYFICQFMKMCWSCSALPRHCVYMITTLRMSFSANDLTARMVKSEGTILTQWLQQYQVKIQSEAELQCKH